MKKHIGNSIKLLTVAALAVIISSCGKPKDLKIGDIHNINVKSIGLTGVELEAVVPVQNTNGYNITAKDAEMDLTADNKVIAHITQTSPPIVIQGNSSADHNVSIRINLLHPGEISSLSNLFSGKSALNIDGTIKLSSFVFTKTVVVHQTNVQEYFKLMANGAKLF
jgi:LEA14-like dessication related protein